MEITLIYLNYGEEYMVFDFKGQCYLEVHYSPNNSRGFNKALYKISKDGKTNTSEDLKDVLLKSGIGIDNYENIEDVIHGILLRSGWRLVP